MAGAKEPVMKELVFMAFPSEAEAEKVRGKLLDLQKHYLIEVDDAVIATRNERGHVKLSQMVHPVRLGGAVGGALWGPLVGALFVVPAAGVALGAAELVAAAVPAVAAAAGAAGASGAFGSLLQDSGIADSEMREQAQALKPGEAGLFVLIGAMKTDQVLADLAGSGGRVVRTTFDEATEKALRLALARHVSATP
jgi:uncharacterized membrane protein